MTSGFTFSHPLKQWSTGEKEEKMGIQKLEYLISKKSLEIERNRKHFLKWKAFFVFI